jgi:hypothetical protein
VNEQPLSLAANGDAWEQLYWGAFASALFPSYEVFWLAHVAPLTNRRTGQLYSASTEKIPAASIRFRTDEELAADGYTGEDVAVAQLHYTFLLHVGRVWRLLDQARAFATGDARKGLAFDPNDFFESFTRLSGASDIADELLERRRTRGSGTYSPWDERAGARARLEWRGNQGDPLKGIRAYRNRLVHGRVVPEWHVRVFDTTGVEHGTQLMYPRLDQVHKHLDWRPAFTPGNLEALLPEFEKADVLVREAWERVLAYAESSWQVHLT